MKSVTRGPRRRTRTRTYSAGSTAALAIHEARMSWHDDERPVDILASEGDSLIGMALLRGNFLTMDVVPGGAGVIEERT